MAKRVVVEFKEPSRTKQSFQGEADINKIVAKARKNGGFVNYVNTRSPIYGDFSNVVGYQEALNLIMEAQRSFGALSASIRERFDNDPGKFVEFVSDPNNRDEAIKIGLIDKPKQEPPATPTQVPVAPVTPTPPSAV